MKVNRSEKELYATPATLHNGNHHKVQECKTKVNNSLERIMGGNIDYIMLWQRKTVNSMGLFVYLFLLSCYCLMGVLYTADPLVPSRTLPLWLLDHS